MLVTAYNDISHASAVIPNQVVVDRPSTPFTWTANTPVSVPDGSTTYMVQVANMFFLIVAIYIVSNI